MVDFERIITDILKYNENKEVVSEIMEELERQGLEYKDGKIQEMSISPNEDLSEKQRVFMGTEALCILQTPTYRIWATVSDSKVKMCFEDAKKWAKSQFSGKGYLPDKAEIMWLWELLDYAVDVTDEEAWYWTEEEYCPNDDDGSYVEHWMLCW